ncbi:Hypothetical protein, putative [Bodo saltans]|uniref:Proteasome activator PA28 C-terminal domain-containing protein n=1 Tax=Bodo saltans TaxID=75058 RepID=A0A0S4ILP6_BODSA|nr:Hypothetical protein, putative [Bodo saltans]|eukprot:CUE71296.1 Hypothetical protein, putative [Bodo saltans]
MAGRRRRESTVPPNPAVIAAKKILEEKRDAFMANIGPLVEHYEANLRRLSENALVEEARIAKGRQEANSTCLNRSSMIVTEGLVRAVADAVGAEADVSTCAIKASDEGQSEELAPHYVVELYFDSNKAIVEEIQYLRKAAMDLAVDLDNVTDWLALSMPNLNEENSVVSEILGGVLEQVASFVETVRAIVAFPKKYHESRTAVEKELLKLPESKALQMQLELQDAETWDEVQKSWKVLIRVCLITHSVLKKNLPALEEAGSEVSTAAASVYY